MSLNMLMSFLSEDKYYISVFCVDDSRPLAEPVSVAFKAEGVEGLFDTLNSSDENFFSKQIVSVRPTSYSTEKGLVPGLDITVSAKEYSDSMGRYKADYPYRDF